MINRVYIVTNTFRSCEICGVFDTIKKAWDCVELYAKLHMSTIPADRIIGTEIGLDDNGKYFAMDVVTASGESAIILVEIHSKLVL